MKVGNYIRDMTAYGIGWHVRIEMNAEDSEALDRARAYLREMVGNIPSEKEEKNGTE